MFSLRPLNVCMRVSSRERLKPLFLGLLSKLRNAMYCSIISFAFCISNTLYPVQAWCQGSERECFGDVPSRFLLTRAPYSSICACRSEMTRIQSIPVDLPVTGTTQSSLSLVWRVIRWIPIKIWITLILTAWIWYKIKYSQPKTVRRGHGHAASSSNS